MSQAQKSLQKNKKFFDDLMKRRFFIAPSFDIYGGVAGFYDFGPSGCAVKNNLENFWREHFILEESMLEVNTTCLTPEKASGHVDRFTDLMVKDLKNGNVYRADKYLVEWCEAQIESKKTQKELKEEYKQVIMKSEIYNQQELDEVFEKYKILSKDNNPLSKSEPFNLMFGTPIGPTGHLAGFLRPETAQGIFINFAKLLDQNNGKLPFAGACLGMGFRNEIAPRAGLLRVREFQMAEIEHFVDPQNKDHPKFQSISHLKLPLFTACNQVNNEPLISDMTLKEAVEKKIIDNETLAYFMGRSFQFLTESGISQNSLRYRQHMSNEMAHYAKDCWDAEIETSYGWIEAVGHADRSAYDLNAHMKVSKVNLQASRLIDPVLKTFTIIHWDKKLLGKHFKKDQLKVINHVEDMTEEDKLTFSKNFQETGSYTFEEDGQSFKIEKDMITKIEELKKNVQEEKYTPSVIEPSFGIGRILYGIFEHCFRMRDEKRTYLSFPPRMAPVKCSILTVINKPEFVPIIENLRKQLIKKGVSCKVDDGNQTIGKKYARTDEIGIPFGITVDQETLINKDVTLREIESTKQIRVPIDDLIKLIQDLIEGDLTFLQVIEEKRYPEFVIESKE